MNDETAPVTHRMGLIEQRKAVEAEPAKVFSELWRYTEADPALMLFTAAVSRFNLSFPPGSRILELGCAESDWLERMAQLQQGYDLVGVDARREDWRAYEGVTFVQGSATHRYLFEAESFDRIVLLGALEHFGLGFYGDQVDEDGDTIAMQNVLRWLRPGGFVYFDVPVQPKFKIPDNRHFRMYAATGQQRGSVRERLIPRLVGDYVLHEVNRAFSLCEPHCGTWCHEPTTWRTPYWFCAMLLQKIDRPRAWY